MTHDAVGLILTPQMTHRGNFAFSLFTLPTYIVLVQHSLLWHTSPCWACWRWRQWWFCLIQKKEKYLKRMSCHRCVKPEDECCTRGVCRTMSNIWDGALREKRSRIKAANYFRKTLHLRCLTGFWIRPCCTIHHSCTIPHWTLSKSRHGMNLKLAPNMSSGNW